MSQTFVQLQDHLAVIINQCDILEDTFSARSEVMSRIDVIRNAVHRLSHAIESRTEFVAEDRRGPRVDAAGKNADLA